MIVPVAFQWRQLDGPQITTISNAIADYLKEMFDTKLDYLNTLNVDTATDEHLSFLGILAGFVRPNTAEVKKQYLVFTSQPEDMSEHGFSDPAHPEYPHGVFSAGTNEKGTSSILDTEHYRALLKAFVKGTNQGELGSLALLDDICYELSQLDAPEVDPFYTFDLAPNNQDIGSVVIDLGDESQWNNSTHVYAVLRSLADTAYAPVPTIYINMRDAPDTESTSPEVPVNNM